MNVSVAPGLNLSAYIQDSQTVFDKAAAMIQSKGKWASSWVGFGTEPNPNPSKGYSGITNDTCASVMPVWIEAGAQANHTFQAQTQAFSICERHRAGGCRKGSGDSDSDSDSDPATLAEPTWPHSAQDQNSTIAAFMIARGPSAVLELVVFGAYFWGSDLTFPPILELDYGPPIGLGSRDGSVYSRHFERGTVHLDCSTWRSTFEPLE